MTEWEQPMTYFPGKVVAKRQKRIQDQITAALVDLRYRGEADAAATFAAMLEDDLGRRTITVAVTGFTLNQRGGVKVRQGDVCDPAAKLKAAVKECDKQTDRLYRACHALRETPGLPEPIEIANSGEDAIVALQALKYLADKMCDAVIAAHGEDIGGPAISERFANDPLDRLAFDLAHAWRWHGHALDRRGRKVFMEVMRALYQAETGQEEIPERAERRISKAL